MTSYGTEQYEAIKTDDLHSKSCLYYILNKTMSLLGTANASVGRTNQAPANRNTNAQNNTRTNNRTGNNNNNNNNNNNKNNNARVPQNNRYPQPNVRNLNTNQQFFGGDGFGNGNNSNTNNNENQDDRNSNDGNQIVCTCDKEAVSFTVRKEGPNQGIKMIT